MSFHHEQLQCLIKKNINNFSRLSPDVIVNHILPHLDNETLIALSSVSTEFRHLINNNDDLWRKICTSTWPSSLRPMLSHIISKFLGGYRSFFSDVFPSIHYRNNPPPPPPVTRFIYAFDVSLHGEQECKPLFTSLQIQRIETEEEYYLPRPINFYKRNLNFIHVKIEECEEYLEEKFKLNCVVIEPYRKRAGSLFHWSCKLVSVKQAFSRVEVVYETVMPGLWEFYTMMVKCEVKVTCFWEDEKEDTLYVRSIKFAMEDMKGKPLLGKHAAIVLLNAIENGERKKK
ncbi:hypothetical protein TSUD_359160 [Trifolium subterraneum]|uniref:F-box domain-containing protein n=1 Tax=Trifolium subterraneum TaxID=3900 RepID=A0A2Z6MJY5_TRISU|nr:hypothetical protein TSUD_359160 [Trifolium subterraneum]